MNDGTGDLLNPARYGLFDTSKTSSGNLRADAELNRGRASSGSTERTWTHAGSYVSSDEEESRRATKKGLISVQSSKFPSTRTLGSTLPEYRYEQEQADEAYDFADTDGRRLVIAIDYGTTFTGVAIAKVPVDEKQANLKDIKVIRDWGTNMSNTDKQWGNDCSADALHMVHTKLELDTQGSKFDELELIIDNLDGMHDLHFEHVERTQGFPEFSANSPELIVEDYMKKIFQRVMLRLKSIPQALLDTLVVDLVITHPVVWSYKAKNATFRAIDRAGFNSQTFRGLRDVMMLSEAEAAAVYTARHLREEDPDKTILNKNDCFVLCDAGGGTVDCVTFKVVETEPILELKEIGVPHSKKCGSSFIDGDFKEWLRSNILDPHKYERLEPNTMRRIKPHQTTGQKMKKVMEEFIAIKRAFTGEEDPDERFKIELPKEFDDCYVEGCLDQGSLSLSMQTMKWLFSVCVDDIVILVRDQAEEARNYPEVRRVKSIFMIGGFSESEYLKAQISKNLVERHIQVYQPKTSWSAVVRGAALYGIEKSRLKNYVRTTKCPFHFAIAQDQEEIAGASKDQYKDPITAKIMGRGNLLWTIRRGDLTLLDSTDCQEQLLAFNFREGDDKVFKIPVFKYLENDDYLPARIRGETDIELEKVLEISISVAQMSSEEFELYTTSNGGTYYQVNVKANLSWKNDNLYALVTCKGKELYNNMSG